MMKNKKLPGTEASGPPAAPNTLTLKTTASCKHCGKPIQWRKTAARKFAPIEPVTGFDHRERCNGMSPLTRVTVRNKNHEAAVNGFFRSLGAPV
jgi:hypothetical protein